MTTQIIEAQCTPAPQVKWWNLHVSIFCLSAAISGYVMSLIGVGMDFQSRWLQTVSERSMIPAILLAFIGAIQLFMFLDSRKAVARWQEEEPIKGYAKSLALAVEKSTGSKGPWQAEG